jgi:hypothetical protein
VSSFCDIFIVGISFSMFLLPAVFVLFFIIREIKYAIFGEQE